MTQSLSSARVDLNPHQVEAAMFAMRSPVSKGVILADEVGLGKTIEAALVIAQRWWEGRRRLLLIAPASLRKQWAQELSEKFSLPSQIIDSKRYKQLQKEGIDKPLEEQTGIIILSYEYAARLADELRHVAWDLVVYDEAHKLRNVFKANEGSRAIVLRDALAGRQKLLLTATPLQNNLKELYGLVSIIDEQFFGSLEAFSAEFGHRTDGVGLALLGRRLQPISKRTLRRQVQKAGLIKYTNRHPRTFDFTPSHLETELYESISSYLQRPEILAISPNGRHLVTLVLRKILGSSSFAIAATLSKMISRLELKSHVANETLADFDGLETEEAEWNEQNNNGDDSSYSNSNDDFDPPALVAEIGELKRYRDLAFSISSNAKGDALLQCLPLVFDEIVGKGGQRKAAIFTESVRTQMFLRDLLEGNGFAGETIILNGSNSDPDNKEIYQNWLAKHQGSDAISGSKTADMKAAIVDAFRNDRSILISTESGAEGINLQFCSLLINYDLPWNPQRVEQRIGRCHRYGQKIDVTVVNFLNRGNQAEQRIFELLESKFLLFDGVFGSSDEILGAIESGVDIEKRILNIVQNCRSNDEINAAFDALQTEFSFEIDEAKKEAREAVLAELDEKVVERLKLQNNNLHQQLDEFKQNLILLAKAELSDAVFAQDDPERFEYQSVIHTTNWQSSEANGWRFFKIGSAGLAQEVMARSKERKLQPSFIQFNYDQYDGNMADIAQLVGQTGWIKLSRLIMKTSAKSYDELIPVAVTDDGTPISVDTATRLMKVPAIEAGQLKEGWPDILDHQTNNGSTVLIAAAQEQLGVFMNEEDERLENWREDAKVSFESQIKALEKEAREKTKQSRASLSLKDKVALQKESGKLKRDADNLKQAYFKRMEEIDKQREKMLDEIAKDLELEPVLEEIFTIQWKVTA